MRINDNEQLQKIARKIRKHVVLMTAEAGSGHYSLHFCIAFKVRFEIQNTLPEMRSNSYLLNLLMG